MYKAFLYSVDTDADVLMLVYVYALTVDEIAEKLKNIIILNNIAVIFFFTIIHPPYFSFILYIIFLLYIILFLFSLFCKQFIFELKIIGNCAFTKMIIIDFNLISY